MNAKDIVKSNALKKLHDYIECEIKRLHDGGLSLNYFEFKPLPGSFTEEEFSEITSIVNSIQSSDGIQTYCKYNNINI